MEKENFAPYPGKLNTDPVMHLVKSIKKDYKTETNNVLPLTESFSNPVRHENFNLFKKISKDTKRVDNTITESLDNKDDTTNTGDKSSTNDTKDSSELIDDLKNEKSALEQQLTALQDNINNNMSQIDETNKQISEKKVRNLQQKREILNKLNVVETRNRMLQLSQEKNIYKTKVINTMIAVILGGLTVSALLYVRAKK